MASSAKAQKIVKAGNVTESNTAWYFANDKESEIVLNVIKAYNNLDAKTYLSYFDDKFVRENKDRVVKEFDMYKTVKREIVSILPMRNDGKSWKGQTVVQIYSHLTKEWKNGSKHKQDEHRVYFVNDTTKKISGSWTGINLNQDNEFGLPNGGKFYSKNDTSTITFSNRGEVETIESLVKDWNKMDGKALGKYFADTVNITTNEGRKLKIANSQWANMFDDVASIEWKLGMINPGKITNTDPESGIIVLSTFKEKKKDGTTKYVNAYHWFMYNINKKITSISWMERPILPK
jgi:hypothetical protein